MTTDVPREAFAAAFTACLTVCPILPAAVLVPRVLAAANPAAFAELAADTACRPCVASAILAGFGRAAGLAGWLGTGLDTFSGVGLAADRWPG